MNHVSQDSQTTAKHGYMHLHNGEVFFVFVCVLQLFTGKQRVCEVP